MKRIFLFLASVIILQSGVLAQQKSDLAALIPDSQDIILLNLNANRILNEVIPQVFENDKNQLLQINQKIAETKSVSGIDLYQIQQVAIGAQISKTQNPETIILLQTNQQTQDIISSLKIFFSGKYREETVNDQKLYIISTKELLEKAKKDKTTQSILNFLLGELGEKSDEMAITTISSNVLAIGSPSFVKLTLTQKSQDKKINNLKIQSNALAAIQLKNPAGIFETMNLIDDDEFGKALSSIQEISGWLDLVNGKFILSLEGRTPDEKQSQTIKETLLTFQSMFQSVIGALNGKNTQIYARILNSLKINSQANVVNLSLEVPKDDVKLLLMKSEPGKSSSQKK